MDKVLKSIKLPYLDVRHSEATMTTLEYITFSYKEHHLFEVIKRYKVYSIKIISDRRVRYEDIAYVGVRRTTKDIIDTLYNTKVYKEIVIKEKLKEFIYG